MRIHADDAYLRPPHLVTSYVYPGRDMFDRTGGGSRERQQSTRSRIGANPGRHSRQIQLSLILKPGDVERGKQRELSIDLRAAFRRVKCKIFNGEDPSVERKLSLQLREARLVLGCADRHLGSRDRSDGY